MVFNFALPLRASCSLSVERIRKNFLMSLGLYSRSFSCFPACWALNVSRNYSNKCVFDCAQLYVPFHSLETCFSVLSHNHETKVCNCCLAGAWPNVLINSQNQIIKTNKENWCRVLTIKFAAKSLWFEPNRVWNFISSLPRRLRKYFINIEQSESHGKLFGSFITLIKEGWKIPKNLKPLKSSPSRDMKNLNLIKKFPSSRPCSRLLAHHVF